MRGFKPVTEELWLHLQRHFTCTQCTEHLAMKQFFIQDHWIRNMVGSAWRQGVALFIHCWLGV